MTENNLSQPESKNPENTASEPSGDSSDTMAVTKASTDAIGRKGIIAISLRQPIWPSCPRPTSW